MAAPDLTALDGLDWAPGARRTTLDTVRDKAVGYALGQERWYREKRPPRRIAGLATRALILLLTALAGVLPLLSDVTDGAVQPIWASIALVLAGALAGIDRYFGLSRSWTRFMASELLIGQRRNTFHFEWNELAIALDEPPTEAQSRKLLGLAQQLVADVDGIVAQETGEWVADFGAGVESQVVSTPTR